MVTVFRTLLGDFDYVALTEVGRSSALVWFMSFMVLLNLVMLNMLLAIVMDVYGDVKGALSDSAETLFSQTYEIYRRWEGKRKKARLGLDQVVNALEKQGSKLQNEKTHEPILLTVRTFMEFVDGLTEKQATRLLQQSEEASYVAEE